ncbi:MAG: HAD family hydrolase [Campylobacterales bacterium]|nr:HAD family hydrolase [Campylobacterales bacterium]
MAILFDLDGTLIDSTEAIIESFGVSFAHFAEPIPPKEKITQHIGHPLEDMFASLGVSQESIDMHVVRYKEHYQKVSKQKTILLPNAKEAVELASKYAKLGVVTTKTGKFSKMLLEHLGLFEYFDVLIGREDVLKPKPDAEPVIKALIKLNIDKKSCWMIGDTCMDILAAKAAGIYSTAVSSGYASVKNLRSCSDEKTIFNDTLDAVKYIIKSY